MNLHAPLGVRGIAWAPEVTHDELITVQAEDESISAVLHWLENECLPSPHELRLHPLETRNLWALGAQLQLQNGILVRVFADKCQLVVPYVLRKGSFSHVHAGPLSAHLGPDNTLGQLKQAYYWPGMRRDVTSWYQS